MALKTNTKKNLGKFSRHLRRFLQGYIHAWILFEFNIFQEKHVDFNILFWDSLLVKEMEISQSGIYPRRIQISWDLSGTNSELYLEIPLFCPRCGSDRIWKTGKDPTRKTKPLKRYCADCGKWFYPHTSHSHHNTQIRRLSQ